MATLVPIPAGRTFVPRAWPIADRIRARVEVAADGCWNWTGSRARNGYGRMRDPDAREAAYTHRLAYVAFIGPIPEGTEVDHLCRNRACCNPDHLEAVSHRENMLRSPVTMAARNTQKTHCPRNHPYDAENTIRRPSGARECRTCRREKLRTWYVARRGGRVAVRPQR